MARMSSEPKKLQKEERRRCQGGTRSPDRVPAPKLPILVLAPTILSLSNEKEKDEDVETSGPADTRFHVTQKSSLCTWFHGWRYFKVSQRWETRPCATVQRLLWGTWMKDRGLYDCVSRNVPPDAGQFDPQYRRCGHDQPRNQADFATHCSVYRNGEKAKALSIQVNNVQRYVWLSSISAYMTPLLWDRDTLLREVIRKYPRSRCPNL